MAVCPPLDRPLELHFEGGNDDVDLVIEIIDQLVQIFDPRLLEVRHENGIIDVVPPVDIAEVNLNVGRERILVHTP